MDPNQLLILNKNDLADFEIALESDRVIYKKIDSVSIFSFDFTVLFQNFRNQF